MILFGVFICVSLMGFYIVPSFLNIQTDISFERNIDMDSVGEFTYNITEIENQVINEAKEYFLFDDIGVDIVLKDTSVWESIYRERTKTIYIGMGDIKDDPEMFKMVLAHEYTHFILYR